MKAAILKQLDTNPVYGDFDDPEPINESQIVINVEAASLKNLDKLKTYENYYAPYKKMPVVVGTDAVGTLPNGKRVYAQGITGTMAQKALISAGRYTPVPDNLDAAVAAALPNAVLGSVVPLIVRAQLKPGQVVLVNGATGNTGKVAVQVAKHYGASKVIAVGRNHNTLEMLKSMGADITISLNDGNDNFYKRLKEIEKELHIDIILDYLWGQPAEIIMESFKNSTAGQVKFVTVGDMADKGISLSSGLFRSTDIALIGSGFGSLTPAVLQRFTGEFLPQMYSLAVNNRLKIETETKQLEDISLAWNSVSNGKRVVIMI